MSQDDFVANNTVCVSEDVTSLACSFPWQMYNHIMLATVILCVFGVGCRVLLCGCSEGFLFRRLEMGLTFDKVFRDPRATPCFFRCNK